MKRQLREAEQKFVRAVASQKSDRESAARTIAHLEEQLRVMSVHRNASAILEALYVRMANLLQDNTEQISPTLKRSILDLTYYGQVFSRPIAKPGKPLDSLTAFV